MESLTLQVGGLIWGGGGVLAGERGGAYIRDFTMLPHLQDVFLPL